MKIQEIHYREDVEVSKEFKENYVGGIRNIIENREQAAVVLRDNYCRDIFNNQEKYREDFKAMLGWPLTEKSAQFVPEVKIKKLAEDEFGTIHRVLVEVLDGFSMTGLLFQKDEKKRPLVIAQHGGQGTPELVANFYGKKTNYNRMIERMLSYDVNVFAPQLLIWDKSYEVEYDRMALDAQLKRLGSSITALEIYGLTRIMDYFEVQPYVSNFGMIGLSYGGFYTLFTAAVDTRIKSAVSCSFFNNRKDYAWNDWTWFHSAEMFSDAEIACLIYPRSLCIEVGTKDETFDIGLARTEISRLRNLSSRAKGNWLDVIEFDGTHEFCWDNEPLKRLAEDIQ